MPEPIFTKRRQAVPFVRPFLGLTLAAAALSLAGCGSSSPEFFNAESTEQWFSKPFTGFSSRDGLVKVADNSVRPATPEDYVDGSGRCAMASVPVQQPVNAETGAPNADMQAGGPTVSGGIALLMTECEVVARAGAPERVDIAANPSGDRTTVLTYTRGPWPAIYHFTAGRLSAIDRVAEPEQPKAAPKKKKAARPKTAAR